MPARNVTTDRFDWRNPLADLHSGFGLARPCARELFLRDAAHVPCGSLNRVYKFRTYLPFRCANLRLGNPHAFARQIRVVQLLRPRKECGIPAFSHVGNDFAGHALSLDILMGAASQQLFLDARREFQYAHHRTILFSGYSTMPCALAAFSFGRICRTTASSIIVLTATHEGSLKLEMVGFLSAGKTASTAARSSRCTLSSKPTLLAAAIAPCSIRIKFSAFFFFQASRTETRFMIKTVADSSTVSTTRNRFARKDEPVSVTST